MQTSALERLDKITMPPPRIPPHGKRMRTDAISPRKTLRQEPYVYWAVTTIECTDSIREWAWDLLPKIALKAIRQLEIEGNGIYYRHGYKVNVVRLHFESRESMEESFSRFSEFGMSVRCGAVFGHESIDYEAYGWKEVYDHISREKCDNDKKIAFHDKLLAYTFPSMLRKGLE